MFICGLPVIPAGVQRRAGIQALALACALFAAAPAQGQADPRLTLRNKAVQGGLVFGRVRGAPRVTLDGKPVQLGAGGYFVFGLAREAKPTAVLCLDWGEGQALTRSLAVRQRKYRIQRINGLPEKYVREIDPTSPLYKRLEREYFLVKAARERFSDLPHYRARFIWPARGRISGVYGSQRILNGKPRRPHYGVDVAAPRGTRVVAAQAGVVALAHPGLYFAGKTIILDHGQGVTTTYIHLSRINVAAGQTVRRGQLIGRIGTTGRSTGPHLHWGLNWGEMYLDPGTLVGPMGRRNK